MTRFAAAALLLALPCAAQAQDAAQRYNDYPTAARADYVFGCMATNGNSREVLIRCSCSIDEIASILPYVQYLEAETVLSMRRVGGERMAVFNSAVAAETLVADLRRAQAEAELVCFWISPASVILGHPRKGPARTGCRRYSWP
ncbi:hypothetical protein SAMN05444340_101462 [Citreimonas salinaria]|uniref:Uncharacterized protein n=1 Tax=Citreimonas salinaria TaxID=321339 RepID=A0A1H3FKT8_9RHOB|nr:hypothetical protein SAMN05444340_101462 [Citreimonas salinaria]